MTSHHTMPPKPKAKAGTKRKLPPEEEVGEDDQINALPENILLQIFSCLPVKERCIASRVCRKWYRILSDDSLWRHVDLLPYRLDLTKMWKVLRAHFSSCLLTMRVKGCAKSVNVKPTMSDAMMKELSARCPNLWSLQLHICNITNLTFDSLPTSLTSLSVTSCFWKPGWMKGGHTHLPNLSTLDLSGTVRVDRFDLADIAAFTNLKDLSISGCYRVKGADIEVVARSITNLKSLDLSYTQTDELGIHHISRHLKSLESLKLCGCGSVTDSCLATIASGLAELEVLDVSRCDSVTREGLACLSKLKKLKQTYSDKKTEAGAL